MLLLTWLLVAFGSCLNSSGSTIKASDEIETRIFAVQKDKLKRKSNQVDCPLQNGAHPTLLPHPSDCGKFYICNNGNPHLKDCLTGLHFNRKLRVCDYPNRAGCVKISTKAPRIKTDKDDKKKECLSKSTSGPFYLPHASDCGKFYICDGSIPHLKSCQPGLHFNRELEICDYPEKAKCSLDSGKGSSEETIVSEVRNCLTDQTDKTYFVPDPHDCTKFIVCHSGNSYLQVCPSGLHFNVDIQVCDYPANAKCNKRLSPISTELKAPGVPSPFCPPIDGENKIFYIHPSNCSIYYFCAHGLAYEFACPAKLHFNIKKEACDYELLAGCQTGKEDEQT